jgi:magnesium transporter
MIVDCAVYDGGERVREEVPFDHAIEEVEKRDGSFVWLGLHKPEEQEFDAVRREFDLHPLAVEDAIKAHQRPKLEVYGESLFVVLRPARYVDPTEVVEIGEILIFLGEGYIVTVRHGDTTKLHDVRLEAEKDPEKLRFGPGAVLYAIVDRVVDDYLPVVEGIEDDIAEVEADVFSPARTNPAERIFNLKREVLSFQRATTPLIAPLQRLTEDHFALIDSELRPYFRDVYDHLEREVPQIDNLDALLNSVLTANLTQIQVQQNEDVRKISAWVAIIAVPTAIAAIYGMNFENMPELKWEYGYPLVLSVIALFCISLYFLFKRWKWL